MDPLSELKARLAAQISSAMAEEGMDVRAEAIDLMERTQGAFGDLSTPVIIREASSRGRSPAEVAQGIVPLLSPPRMIERVEALRGYLNFHVNWDAFTPEVLGHIIASGNSFGRPDEPKGTLVLEHTSVNPTGPLNIARSRNSIIGDTLYRVFGHRGWTVRRHYLLNDMGHQIVVIYWGRKKGIRSKELEKRYRAYAAKKDFDAFFTYVPAAAKARQDPRVEAEIAELESRVRPDSRLLEELRAQSRGCLEGQLETLRRLGIEFDEIMPESQFLDKLDDILRRLRSKGIADESEDGSIGLDLSSLGLARRRTKLMTLVKSDGSSTYTLRDIAYHEWKFGRGDSFITVLGEDHKREFKELQAILRMLGHEEDLRAAFYSFVTYEGGKKMSTRRGQTVPLDQIIDDAVSRARAEVRERRAELEEEKMDSIAAQVGIGAIKFNILKVDPSKSIRFRWEEAINFAGDSSAYVQYACARASSILRKAGDLRAKDLGVLSAPEERDLVWAMARAPGMIAKSANDMKPNLLAEHAIEVATLFNRFYMQHRVIQADEPLRSARLRLVACVRVVLSLLLDLLGIAAPDEI